MCAFSNNDSGDTESHPCGAFKSKVELKKPIGSHLNFPKTYIDLFGGKEEVPIFGEIPKERENKTVDSGLFKNVFFKTNEEEWK